MAPPDWVKLQSETDWIEMETALELDALTGSWDATLAMAVEIATWTGEPAHRPFARLVMMMTDEKMRER